VGIYLVLADGTYQSFGMYLVYFLLVVSSYDILPILDTVESKLYSTAAVLDFVHTATVLYPFTVWLAVGEGYTVCIYIHVHFYYLTETSVG